jgi:hypothetical protein
VIGVANVTNSITLYSDRGTTSAAVGEIQTLSQTTLGTGYTTANNVATTALTGAGTGATVDIVATVIGEVTDVTIQSGGQSYTAGTEGCTGGTGTAATFDITVDGNGTILTAAVNSGGSGYTINDILTINNGDGLGRVLVDTMTNGEITSIVINNGGTGYNVWDVVQVDGGTSGQFEVSTIDVPSIAYVPEFVGCQKKVPTHKVVQQRESYSVYFQDMEIEFVGVEKISSENAMLERLATGWTYEGQSASVAKHFFNGVPHAFGVPASNVLYSQYVDKAQFLQKWYDNKGTIITQLSLNPGNVWLYYKLSEIYTGFNNLLKLTAAAVHTGLDGTTPIAYTQHDHANEGINYDHQNGSTENSAIVSGAADTSLYVLGFASEFNNRNYISLHPIGGVLSNAKGSWADEFSNMWNLLDFFPSSFGVRLRYVYSCGSAPNYNATCTIIAEPVFSTSGNSIDLFDHQQDKYPEVEIGAQSLRSAEAHASGREKLVKEWEYKSPGGDAETNAEFRLVLTSIPNPGEGEGAAFVYDRNIFIVPDGTSEKAMYTASGGEVASPTNLLARVNENCVWNLGSGIIRRVCSPDDEYLYDPINRALNSTAGTLLTTGIVDIYGRYAQAEYELEVAYSDDLGIDKIGLLYTVNMRLASQYDYLGTDAVYLKYKVNHLSGTLQATFLTIDTGAM